MQDLLRRNWLPPMRNDRSVWGMCAAIASMPLLLQPAYGQQAELRDLFGEILREVAKPP